MDKKILFARNHIYLTVPVTHMISHLTGMNICGYLIFTKRKSRYIHYYVIAIWLTPKSDTEKYGDIIARIRNIFNDDLYHRQDGSTAFSDGFLISPASEIFTEPAWVNKRAFDTFDKSELRRLPTHGSALFFPDQRCGPALSITSLSYCLRVKLHPTEYRIINDTLNLPLTIVLVASGRTIYINNYEQMAEGYISLCISDYLLFKSSVGKHRNKTLTEYLTDDNNIYIVIGLGVLIALLIAAFVFCRVK